MTALVCITTANMQLNRYDTDRDEGLTHVGFLRGAEGDTAALVEDFRTTPPSELRSEVYIASMEAELATQRRIYELVGELTGLGVTDIRLVQSEIAARRALIAPQTSPPAGPAVA